MQPSGPTFKRFVFLGLVGLLKRPTRKQIGETWLMLGFNEQDMAIRRNIDYLHNQYDVVVTLDKALFPEEGGTYIVKNWSFIDTELFLWKFRPLLTNAGIKSSDLRPDNIYVVPKLEDLR